MQNNKQARFWTMHPTGGIVRIKVNNGQTLRHYHGERTDEGYNSQSNDWYFDGEIVSNKWLNDGRDCDGRTSYYGESFCHISNLYAGYGDLESGVSFPKWGNRDQWQRDYTAESEGY